MRDAATGDVQADLGTWTGAAGTSAGQPLVLTRYERESGSDGIRGAATRRDGGAAARAAGSVAYDCSANDRLIACRVADGLEVWSISP